MKNKLEILFEEFNKKKINYCVRGRYKHLPKTLDNGDVDILIKKTDFPAAQEIIKKMNFVFYRFAKPNLFYFCYDKNLGLIQLDILLSMKFPEIKKFRNFYIPADGKTIPNKKIFVRKVFTFLRRRLHYLFNGKLIVFEGPDGSGKSTNANALFNSMPRFPIKREFIHFATHFKDKKPSAIKRAYTRAFSLIRTYVNIILGRITITDRYIYLTFRKSNPLIRKIFRALAPKPDILFLMKARLKTIRARKKGQRDQLSEETIKELYRVYENIPGVNLTGINTEMPIKENLEKISKEVLKTCCN